MSLLFDRTRSLSLHLFEHVHGESRDRGQAMIDLKSQYEQAWPLHEREPSCRISCRCSWNISRRCRAQEACDTLGQPAHIFAALAERLRKRQSPYEAVFRALVALAAAKPKDESLGAASVARSGCHRPRGARRRLGGRAGQLRPRRQRQLQGRADRPRPRRPASRARRCTASRSNPRS